MTSTRTVLAASAVLGLTLLGVLLALADPALAGHTPPHAALNGTITDALWILQNNLRVLAVPFLLAALRFPEGRLGHCGGRRRTRWWQRLIPYLPQLPLEWAALTIATSAWLNARHGETRPRELAVLSATTAVLLIGAASLETWCTPHRVPGTHSAPAPVVPGRLVGGSFSGWQRAR
jgi:hypothetical protein